MDANFIAKEYAPIIATRQAILIKLLEEMKAKGTTYHRASICEETKEIYLEGWLERPDDQGPLPFDKNGKQLIYSDFSI
jgi:hypothetical protein